MPTDGQTQKVWKHTKTEEIEETACGDTACFICVSIYVSTQPEKKTFFSISRCLFFFCSMMKYVGLLGQVFLLQTISGHMYEEMRGKRMLRDKRRDIGV